MNGTCIVPGNRRGGRILLHDGFRYARKSVSTSQMRWVCTEKGCGAYAYTDFFDVNDDKNQRISGNYCTPSLHVSRKFVSSTTIKPTFVKIIMN
jgi:hypothetical protein